jgi:hypothetical protein
MRRILLFLAALTISTLAQADSVLLPVPDENWVVRFDGPALAERRTQSGAPGYHYEGTAGKLMVSLFVEPPGCPGGDVNAVRYKCFLDKLLAIPMVISSSIRANEVAGGVQVMYMAAMQMDGARVLSFNMHLLFTRDGKEGDFHASVTPPREADVPFLADLMKSVRIEGK